MPSQSQPCFPILLSAGLLWSLVPVPAQAQESIANDEAITGGISFELQFDHAYRSDDPGKERNTALLKAEPEILFRLGRTSGLSIYAHGVLEPVADPDPGKDHIFEDEGLYIEDLFLQFERGPVHLRAGKLNPGFGIAWDAAPGIYGSELAEDYEVAERIGATATYGFGTGPLGPQSITAGTFFLDTTFLSGSALRSRGHTSKADGGVSNTEDFSSYNLVLESDALAGIEGLTYHLAWMHQARGTGGTSDQDGYAAALAYALPVGNATLSPLVEYVRLDDADGVSGQTRTYLTAAAEIGWHRLYLNTAWTSRRTEQSGTPDVDDDQIQFTAGYMVGYGITAEIGWKHRNEAGAATQTAGLRFLYGVEF